MRPSSVPSADCLFAPTLPSAGRGTGRWHFDLADEETFTEVLYPQSIADLVDYHTREYIKREVRMRVCKNCGKYFAISGRSTTEYCDRVFDSKGRTSKEIGAIAWWNRSKSDDDVFKEYRREYKKRFAWIKAGKIDSDVFYAWSEEARKKKPPAKQATYL